MTVSQIVQHDFAGGSPVAGHYHAKSLGTPFSVFLTNGVQTKFDHTTGKWVTEITNLPGLIAAVVRTRVMHPRKLSSAELRFIREALCVKSKDIAKDIQVTPSHYSRYENGQKTMSPATEMVYRANAYLRSLELDKYFKRAVEEAKKEQEKEQKKEVSPEKATKALSEFRKLFFEMKIIPVCGADEDLIFVFSRGCREQPCGEEGTEWTDTIEKAA
jgi:transcriptional regulator with XRE-family HTH domain